MKKKHIGTIAVQSINGLFLIIISILMIYPFLNVLAISLNDSVDSMKGGITFYPRAFTINNYIAIFQHPQLLSATQVTLMRTVIGLITSLLITSMLAFVLSKQDLIGYKFVNAAFVISMFLNAGLIPTFMLYKQIHISNTFAVYILPTAVGIFNMILLRNAFDTLPDSLEESAKIDGANDLFIFFRIILPLSVPTLATVALFVAVWQWNAWTDTLYYSSSESLETLQYLLMKIIRQTEAMQFSARIRAQDRAATTVTSDSVKMAITMVTTVPILCVYPFLQRYFVGGVMVGAIKG